MQLATLFLRLSALAIVLSACAGQPQQGIPEMGWQQRQQLLTKLADWSFSGKVLVKTADSADSARLHWQQQANDLELRLSGPVGLKEVSVRRRDGQVSVLRDGKWQTMGTTDDALRREFGWSLPLAYLPWWLKGLPSPAITSRQTRGNNGELGQLQQAGWTLDYLEYQAVEQHWLPARIDFSRGEVKGKILLKHWTLTP